jgi:hypothetical protein
MCKWVISEVQICIYIHTHTHTQGWVKKFPAWYKSRAKWKMLRGIHRAVFGEVNISVSVCVEIKGDYIKQMAKLFYFCHLKKFVRPENFGPTLAYIYIYIYIYIYWKFFLQPQREQSMCSILLCSGKYLRRPKTNEATESLGTFLNMDVSDLYSLQNALTISGHEARMGKSRYTQHFSRKA